MIQKEGHVGAKVKENECENMLKKTRLFYLGKAQIVATGIAEMRAGIVELGTGFQTEPVLEYIVNCTKILS